MLGNGSSMAKSPRPTEGWLVAPHVDGVILLDLNHSILAMDDGATAILRDSGPVAAETDNPPRVPSEILDCLQAGHTRSPYRKLRIRVGSCAYICRIYSMQSRLEGLPAYITVLHLTRDLTIADTLSRIGSEYRLTAREVQALEGVLMGLSSKEVADRMGISPNTVKAFLRLVMGKMGVTSRAGIVARVFEPNGHG
jgi:DNA-binding CsgD family transcriptional regulator